MRRGKKKERRPLLSKARRSAFLKKATLSLGGRIPTILFQPSVTTAETEQRQSRGRENRQSGLMKGEKKKRN